MSDLLDSLSMAARSLAAQQAGLDATGQNIANINTPGYTRRDRRVRRRAARPTRSAPAMAWTSSAIHAARADLLEAQLRHEQPAQGRDAAMADSLSQIETALGTAGGSVDAGLTNFFNAFTAAGAGPDLRCRPPAGDGARPGAGQRRSTTSRPRLSSAQQRRGRAGEVRRRSDQRARQPDRLVECGDRRSRASSASEGVARQAGRGAELAVAADRHRRACREPTAARTSRSATVARWSSARTPTSSA